MRLAFVCVGVATATLLIGPELHAQIADHLKCYRVKDSLAGATYTADLEGLTVEPGCVIRTPATMLCVQAIKTNVTPAPPGGGGTAPAGRFACYKVKCPKDDPSQVAFADQFGARLLVPSKSQLLCAPETGLGNEPPVANAGPDQALPDAGGDGAEVVTLDGSQSRDPEGGALLYTYSAPGPVDPNGILTVTLPVGVHTITLSVLDPEGAGDDDEVTITVSEALAEETVIAADDFESTGFSGGTGWSGSWVHIGDAFVVATDGPQSGSRHARLRSTSGLIRRRVDMTGVTAPRLKVWVKGSSLESSDTTSIRASDGVAPAVTIMTFSATHADGEYHYHEFDLSPFVSQSTEITFDANMSGTNDYFYVDQLEVTGIR
jgi:hypothetical protein